MGAQVWMPVRIHRLGPTQWDWFDTTQGGMNPPSQAWGTGPHATHMHGSAPTRSKMCPPFCTSRLERDAAKSRYPEAAAAGRNFPDCFPQAPPSYRTRAISVASPLSSVPVTACACFSTHSNQRQQSTTLMHAKICTATSTLWGAKPWQMQASSQI